ncbi:MAG: acyl-CoA thioesterase YbgC [Candidatus Latescibacteria bacterium ADurb.Bin168]|nr:MAG: acyl-CoA thioesterase YbgC [Candidatus Latescibacteria bacterium ADurb.Bin168]
MSTGSHSCVIRSRLKETSFDHVYFGTLFTWFEVARTEMGRAAGLPYVELEKNRIGSFVTAAGAQYHRPIPAGAKVTVEARMAEMGRARCSFAYAVFTGNDESPAVTGYTDHIAADFSGKPTRLPARFAEAFVSTGESIRRPSFEEPARVHWSTDLRVRYEETDAFGVVYNGNYFAWMEAAWSEHLADNGVDVAEAFKKGQTYPVVEASCRLLSPLRYDDPVSIEVESRLEGRTRVALRYRFIATSTGITAGIGQMVHAVVDKGRVVPVPRELAHALGITDS